MNGDRKALSEFGSDYLNTADYSESGDFKKLSEKSIL